MANFDVTADPERGAVRIAIGGWSGSAKPVVLRTDTNGTHVVRVDTTKTTVYDHEAALTGWITYDVTMPLVGGLTQDYSRRVRLDAAGPRIHAVALPELEYLPHHLTPSYSASIDTGATVHRPVMRSSPIIVSGPARTREGGFELWCPTFENATAAAHVLHSGDGTMMLRQREHDGMDMYFVAPRAVVSPAGSEPAAAGWRWMVRVDFVELGYPSTPLRPARTFQSVIDESDTFREVRDTYEDFGQLNSGVWG